MHHLTRFSFFLLLCSLSDSLYAARTVELQARRRASRVAMEEFLRLPARDQEIPANLRRFFGRNTLEPGELAAVRERRIFEDTPVARRLRGELYRSAVTEGLIYDRNVPLMETRRDSINAEAMRRAEFETLRAGERREMTDLEAEARTRLAGTGTAHEGTAALRGEVNALITRHRRGLENPPTTEARESELVRDSLTVSEVRDLIDEVHRAANGGLTVEAQPGQPQRRVNLTTREAEQFRMAAASALQTSRTPAKEIAELRQILREPQERRRESLETRAETARAKNEALRDILRAELGMPGRDLPELIAAARQRGLDLQRLGERAGEVATEALARRAPEGAQRNTLSRILNAAICAACPSVSNLQPSRGSACPMDSPYSRMRRGVTASIRPTSSPHNQMAKEPAPSGREKSHDGHF